MKKLNKYFYFLLLSSLFVLSSCEDENPTFYKNAEGFIQFASTSADLAENNTAGLTTTVLFGGASNDNGITVNYTVTSDDNTRFTDMNNGTVEIPAGQRSAEIVIVPVDNARTDGNLEIVLELSTSSDKPVGIGGEGVNSNTKTITIVDNDCPINLDDWVGTYTVQEEFSAGGTNAGLSLAANFTETYQIEISKDPTDTDGIRVILNNSAGANQFIPNGTVMTFDTCNGAVSFAGTVNIALFRDMTVNETSYSDSNFTIFAKGPLGTFGDYEFTLTKQ